MIPFNNFRTYTKDEQTKKVSATFEIISSKLKAKDTDFFHDAMVNENKGFLFQIELSYPTKSINCLARNLDLSSFLVRCKIIEEDLTPFQRDNASHLGCTLKREGSKLISDSPESILHTEYSGNLLWLMVHHLAEIVDIYSITTFNCYPVMRPYMSFLQK